MNKLLNIIPSGDSCCILLYGEVGGWGDVKAGEVVKELLEAQALYKKIDVRINSIGGEVYSGIAIFNALRNSTADITIYIDCIAASIASVIASCGKPLKMSRYGRIMIHRISGCVAGNADDMEKAIEQMEALEDLLCDIYAARTGQSAEDIRNTYFDGDDHWLSAQEALQIGFIDEIYDNVTPLPVDENSPANVLHAAYNKQYFNQLTNNNMLNQIKTIQVFAACADEAAVMTKLNELVNKSAKVDGLMSENATLQASNAAYKKAETERHATNIAAMVDDAIKARKITAADREQYVALAQAQYAATKAILDKMPAAVDLSDVGVDGVEPLVFKAGDAWNSKLRETGQIK